LRALHRHEFREFPPYPKVHSKLPHILNCEEVARLIEASSGLFERTRLMVLYGTGMRRAEIARLKVADIDSRRIIIHVVNGKGGKDRDLPLSPALLDTLRAYWPIGLVCGCTEVRSLSRSCARPSQCRMAFAKRIHQSV
jgi:integrase/recombinase XerD